MSQSLQFFMLLMSFIISLSLAIVLFTLSYLLAKKNTDLEKVSSYECGFEAFNSGRILFDIQFYIVSILFIIFDVEVAYLVPWAINLNNINCWGYTSMFIFFFILILGFIYEWLKGSLDWANTRVIY